MEAGYDSDEQDDCDNSQPSCFVFRLHFRGLELRIRLARDSWRGRLPRDCKFRGRWSGPLCGRVLVGVSFELAFKRLDIPAVDTESGNDTLGNAQQVLWHVPMLLRSGGEARNSKTVKLPKLVLRMATERTRELFQRFHLRVHVGAFLTLLI